jgi:hypothetical protein
VGVPLGVLLIAAFGAVRFCAPPVRQPRPPTAARPTMSVVPFADGGDGSFGRQLARDVATQLEWFRRWDFVLRDMASPGVSTAPGAHPPTRLRAKGDIVARDADTRFQLMIRAGERLEHVVEVPGSAHDRLGWARSIADSIVRRTFPQFADEFRYYAQRSSRNVPAHEALNAGQDAFRRDARGAAALAEQWLDGLTADRTLLWVEAWDIHEWPQREAQPGEVDVAVGAVARLRRAALAAAAGRFELAHDLASRVDQLWADAEPPYGGPRETARALARRRPQ